MRSKLTAFLAVPAAALLVAAARNDGPVQEDFRWSGALAAGQRIEIKGVNGAIRAEPSNGSQVEVTAVKRAGRRGDVEDVRIERLTHDGGVTICAVYPSGSRNHTNRCTPGAAGPRTWKTTTCAWSGWCASRVAFTFSGRR